jgi:protein-serine/threonine kinase
MAYNKDERNPNRLQLNFGGGYGNTQQNFTAEQARAYPTTPSTFPQPFPNAAGQQEVWGAQSPQTGMNGQGYFANFNPNPYGNQYQQPMPSPGPGAGFRAPTTGFNEVTNGFAQQMNLGGNTPRSASPYNRNASPANARPRTGNSQQQYGATYLHAPMPQQPAQPSIYDDVAPPKNPEKYSAALSERVRHQKLLTGEFFKENVERAKTRNER